MYFSRSRLNRWTPVEEVPGVCYFALSETGAIAETVCRDASYLEEEEKSVSMAYLSSLAMYQVQASNPIQVLDLTVSNLAAYRLDAGILADYAPGLDPPYRFCPAWSSHAVSLGLGGILYRSRHAIDEPCLALFEGAAPGAGFSCISSLDHPDYLAILDENFNWPVI
jgi:hypothetical protein